MTRAIDVLRVPVAIDAAGLAVVASEASRGTRYHCPECSGLIVLRDGGRRVRHFAHHRANVACPLQVDGNGFIHRAASIAIVAAFERWRRGTATAPLISYRCRRRSHRAAPACDCAVEFSTAGLPAARAVREHAVSDRDVRLDVALLDDDGGVVLGIEVRDTHPVDAPKRERLAGVPFLEVDALAILQNWLVWASLQDDGLDAFGGCACAPPSRAEGRPRLARFGRTESGPQRLPMYGLWNARDESTPYRIAVPHCPEAKRTDRWGVPCVRCTHHGGYTADRPDSWPVGGERWGSVNCRHPAFGGAAAPSTGGRPDYTRPAPREGIRPGPHHAHVSGRQRGKTA